MSTTDAPPSMLSMVARYVLVSLGAAVTVALVVSMLIAMVFGGDLVGTAEFAFSLDPPMSLGVEQVS